MAASGTHEELLASSPGYRSVVARAMEEDSEQPAAAGSTQTAPGAAGTGYASGGGEGR